MTDDDSAQPGATPPAAPTPPSSPGERRLAHPPSDRYRAAEARAAAAAATGDPSASVARGVVVGAVSAIVGAVTIVSFGGILTITDGLIVVAGFTGLAVAIALRWGAGGELSSRRRTALAIGLAVGAVALGQIGLWKYGLTEGGVLGLLDYLGQVYGPLVLVEFAAAVVVAWLAAR
ncbi:MAG: hypothetical protein ABI553_01575 [Chloroflexota bacterium]